jgi:serine protease Do
MPSGRKAAHDLNAAGRGIKFRFSRQLSVALAATLLSSAALTGQTFAQQDATFRRAPMSFADLADKVRPAVVSVNVKSAAGFASLGQEVPLPGLPDFIDPDKRNKQERRPTRAQGSGFLISADGYVVTNHHVADKADEIEVMFENDEKYKATVVGSDARTDLALLKLKTDKTFSNYLEFADTPPRVGDWVLAVGNPFGLGGTVTAGIVSALARDIGTGPYEFLQIDAAVNRGNSGGPAVNLDGKVVGVNTAIYSPSGGSVGIAFAVPASTAKDVIEKLRTTGKVASGWLGVQIQNIDENMAQTLGLKEARGALISKIIPDSPALKADLRAQDVILRVEEKPIKNSKELARVIASMSPNADAHLHIIRDGAEKDVIVKLGEFPSAEKLALATPENENPAPTDLADLGLSLSEGGAQRGKGKTEGVVVERVEPDSKAAEAGLHEGDVIIEVDRKKVASASDVVESIKEARAQGKKRALIKMRAGTEQRFLTLPLQEAEGSGDNRDNPTRPN